jgi:hypothetical protein
MAGRLLAGLLLALLISNRLPADDPKLPDATAFDRLVVDTLRDVHNKGADLYNVKKEFDGTYRMYQGALLTIRPLLAHRPAAQKIIDEGLAAAESEASMAQKAFRLHEAIEAVRSNLKAGGTPPKPVEPTEVAPEPKPKAPAIAPAAAGKGPSGIVTLQGKPLGAAEITMVSLDLPKPQVFTAAIQPDGHYAFAEPLPAGKYVVTVTAAAVPAKYQTTTTSGITIEVKADGGTFDIDLK